MKGLNVLITAGPTHEAIDPVRFIGNHSSGKMGYAIAEAFLEAGAQVNLVSGPTNLTPADGINLIKVTSSDEMFAATEKLFSTADIYILSAAVADYKPAHVAEQKIKKKGNEMTLSLVKTIDIAKALGKLKTPDQIGIGFALETNNEEDNAREKLKKKNFDFIVLNSMQNAGTCFGSDNNQIKIISKTKELAFDIKPKRAVAQDILNYTANLLVQNASS